MSTPCDADLIVVAHPDRDLLALQFAQHVRSRERTAVVVDGVTAARLFTVRRTVIGATVTPAVPILIRASGWWTKGFEDSDEVFLYSEAWATFWAASRLTSAPVINRPSDVGLYGRATGIASYDEGTAGLSRRSELFVSTRERLPTTVDTLWGESLLTFETYPRDELPSDMPLRLRAVKPQGAYEAVTVVGKRAFAMTDDPLTNVLSLGTRSINIAEALGLSFATVLWCVDGDEAYIARISHAPSLSDVQGRRLDVFDALWSELFECS